MCMCVRECVCLTGVSGPPVDSLSVCRHPSPGSWDPPLHLLADPFLHSHHQIHCLRDFARYLYGDRKCLPPRRYFTTKMRSSNHKSQHLLNAYGEQGPRSTLLLVKRLTNLCSAFDETGPGAQRGGVICL